mmetsp:Transcript_122593/g.291488  ORF Transcript_122593/g.291488 Transcript_122593/m.291488 type:complete len:224 (+) Transcript_122593:57-728(+)
MKVFCAMLPMLVVALREKNEPQLSNLATESVERSAVCCVEANPHLAAAAFQDKAEKAFLDLVNTGAYENADATALTGRVITHCEALGVRDAKCPKNVNVLSMRAHEVPEMRKAAGERLQSFADSNVFWTKEVGFFSSTPDCSQVHAGSVAADANRCGEELGDFLNLAKLWGKKLVNDWQLYDLNHNGLGMHKIYKSHDTKDHIRRVEEDSMRLVAEAKRLWAE